jgi:alkyl hydroperoxide reductase subunit AhpF
MQFHLNGFRPGDQQISEAAEPADASPHSDPLPEEIDVLIVGCGPAGLTLAAQLAAFPDIKTRIVDQKSGPVRLTASRAAQWRCSRRSVSASGC